MIVPLTRNDVRAPITHRDSLPPFTCYDVLPPGDYELTLAQLRQSHLVTGEGNSSRTWDKQWRAQLVTNLSILVRQLWQVGINTVFIDGSFVENKDHPNDIDGYFEVDEAAFITGQMEQDLNKIDPYKSWTWAHRNRRPDPNSTKLQLPLWHRYHVELYPHFGQPAGILDEHGNELMFPAAFRKSRVNYQPKGIVQIIRDERS